MMRKRVLLDSVQRRLPGGEHVERAAYMWCRHRWMIPFTLAALVAVALVAALAGFDTWFERIGLGLGGAAIAATATTDYHVLAGTNNGLVLFRASRIRQVATELLERIDNDTPVRRIGGTMLANDWTVGERQFTVAKASEHDMVVMSGAMD